MSEATTPTTDNLNPPSLLDDDSLNDSERKFIELFERRATSSLDAVDDVPASAEDEGEPASPPVTPDPSAAPVPPTQIEGSDDGGTENDDSVPPPTSEGDAGTGDSGTPQSSDSVPAFTFAGQDYSADELARAVQVSAWHQQLSDQQVVAIDALLSGQYRLVPADNPSPASIAPAAPPATSSASSSTAPAATAPIDDDAEEWLDPKVKDEITRLRSELGQLQQSVQQQVSPLVQQQMNESMQHRVLAIDSATQSFAKEYALTEQQVSDVLTAATQAQILPGLLARHNNDVAAATRAALDMMFWTTPSFRDSYVQARTAADLAALSEQERAGKVKQQQMTALSASGGSVPRRDPRPTTKEDRHSAMVAEIAAAQNGQ